MHKHSLINATQAASLLNCNSHNAFSVLKKRIDFPKPVDKQGSNVLWRRQDIIAFQRAGLALQPELLVSVLSQRFLAGEFAPEHQRLQAMSLRSLARLNRSKSIATIQSKGVYLCKH